MGVARQNLSRQIEGEKSSQSHIPALFKPVDAQQTLFMPFQIETMIRDKEKDGGGGEGELGGEEICSKRGCEVVGLK